MTRWAVTAWCWDYATNFGFIPVDDTIRAATAEDARRIMRQSFDDSTDIQCIEVREEPAALDAGGARARGAAE